MEILSVLDRRFAAYGQVLENYGLAEILHCLEENTPMPEEGTVYLPWNTTSIVTSTSRPPT